MNTTLVNKLIEFQATQSWIEDMVNAYMKVAYPETTSRYFFTLTHIKCEKDHVMAIVEYYIHDWGSETTEIQIPYEVFELQADELPAFLQKNPAIPVKF